MKERKMDQVLLDLDDGFSLDQGWKPPVPFSRVKSVVSAAHQHRSNNNNNSGSSIRERIEQFAKLGFQEALRELEVKREQRAARLVDEARRRANERGGGPLPQFEKMIDYTPYAGSFSKYIDKLCKRFNNMCYIPRIEDSFADPAYEIRGFAGDEVLRSLRSVYSRFPEPPTPFQWKMFDATCCAGKRLIYGSEYDADPNWVLERNGWTEGNILYYRARV